MNRYKVPRIAFINKLDRPGANLDRVVSQLRYFKAIYALRWYYFRFKLHHNAALVQIPIGLERNHEGVIDIIRNKALFFTGNNG